MKEGIPQKLAVGPKVRSFVDRKDAIHYALEHAQENDVVIIAGKGHETTQEIKGVKYPFSDKEVAESW